MDTAHRRAEIHVEPGALHRHAICIISYEFSTTVAFQGISNASFYLFSIFQASSGSLNRSGYQYSTYLRRYLISCNIDNCHNSIVLVRGKFCTVPVEHQLFFLGRYQRRSSGYPCVQMNETQNSISTENSWWFGT